MKDIYREIVTCPMCDCTDFKTLYFSDAGGADDHQRKLLDKLPVVKCENCGFVWSQFVLSESALNDFFENYSSNVHEDSEDVVSKRNLMYQLEFDYIAQFIDFSRRIKVLDIGCAEGKFLDFFSRSGFDCYGVEIGKEACEIAAQKHKVYFGNFPDLSFKEKFDLVISRGTLEYFYEPRKYLDKMDEILNDGGMVYITSLPNAASFCHNLFKDFFRLPVCAVAQNGFTPEGLKKYWKEKKYILVGEKYFYDETPYANPIEDIKTVYKAIECLESNKKIDFRSPAFWGNQMTLVFQKYKG